MQERRRVAIALGSNLGDRTAHLRHAVACLGRRLDDLRVSRFIETEAQGVGPQPAFLNAALVGVWAGSPVALLEVLLEIERERARMRPFPGAPRTLDLDLILVGTLVVSAPGLELPHPRFRDRLFVLRPLAEIAPAAIDPVTGRSVAALLARAERKLGSPGPGDAC